MDNSAEFFFVRQDGVLKKIVLSKILYVQALGDFVSVFFAASERDVMYGQITIAEQHLKRMSDRFVRCHRSYVVNTDKIEQIEGNTIYLDGKIAIPLGDGYKDELFKAIGLVSFNKNQT